MASSLSFRSLPAYAGAAPASTGGVRAYTPQYGGVPSVPDIGGSQSAAVGANKGNAQSIYDLAGGTNTFNAGQAQNQLMLNLPGYSNLINQSSSNIGSLLKGQIPNDVLQLLSQQGAERGVMTGTEGSPSNMTALMRSLGLTSLGLMKEGEGELTGAVSRTPTAKLFDPSNLFVTPEQEQEARYAANVSGAAPDPGAHAAELIRLARLGAGMGQGGSGGWHAPVWSGGPTAGGRQQIGPGGTAFGLPETSYGTYDSNPGSQLGSVVKPGQTADEQLKAALQALGIGNEDSPPAVDQPYG